jgi:hypothetical protein
MIDANALQIVYLIVVFAAFIIGIIYREYHEFNIKILPILLFIILIVETSGYTLKWFLGVNNQFLFHIYGPIEYGFIAYLYGSSYENKMLRNISFFSVITFVIFSIYCTLYLQKITDTPYNFLLRCLLILSMVLWYFYEIYNRPEIVNLYKLPLFWISVGNFFFYMGNFFLMGLIDTIEKQHPEIVNSLWLINVFLNIFLYVMFSIGFLCKKI